MFEMVRLADVHLKLAGKSKPVEKQEHIQALSHKKGREGRYV